LHYITYARYLLAAPGTRGLLVVVRRSRLNGSDEGEGSGRAEFLRKPRQFHNRVFDLLPPIRGLTSNTPLAIQRVDRNPADFVTTRALT
jgi:hypothetical protein